MNPAHGAWRRCEKIVACVLDGSEDSETRAKSRRRRRGERGLTAWRTAPARHAACAPRVRHRTIAPSPSLRVLRSPSREPASRHSVITLAQRTAAPAGTVTTTSWPSRSRRASARPPPMDRPGYHSIQEKSDQPTGMIPPRVQDIVACPGPSISGDAAVVVHGSACAGRAIMTR